MAKRTFSALKQGDSIFHLYGLLEVSEWQLTTDFEQVKDGPSIGMYKARAVQISKPGSYEREVFIPKSSFKQEFSKTYAWYASTDKMKETLKENLTHLKSRYNEEIAKLEEKLAKEKQHLAEAETFEERLENNDFIGWR